MSEPLQGLPPTPGQPAAWQEGARAVEAGTPAYWVCIYLGLNAALAAEDARTPVWSAGLIVAPGGRLTPLWLSPSG